MILRVILFFIGWILSPFTWWNDAFVNIPLSYLIANVLFYITPLSFIWLVVGSYWFTNIVGLFFMYSSGKSLIGYSRNRRKAVILILVFVSVYTLAMVYLDRTGKLKPICVFFEKYCVSK